jgi:Uma2 family endonuclease
VLSLGNQNRKRDLESKRGLYARFGVEEYWIVDREKRCVMIFRLHDQTLEESVVLHEGDDLTSSSLPGFVVKVGSLFVLPEHTD